MANDNELFGESGNGERGRAAKRDDESEIIARWISHAEKENGGGKRDVAAALESMFLFRRHGTRARRVGRVHGELRSVGRAEVR